MSAVVQEARAGTIGLARIKGPVGWLIWVLQALNGDLSKWTHTFIVINNHELFEARPSGARILDLSYWSGTDVVYLEPFTLTEEQRLDLGATAYRYRGIGYNWATYLYLAAYRLRLPVLTAILRKRVTNNKKMICSQAVDRIYQDCGLRLFNDGRLPCDVTPGDFQVFLED